MSSLLLNHHFTQLHSNITSTRSNVIVCAVTQFGLDDTKFADSLSQLINTRANSYFVDFVGLIATFLSVHNEANADVNTLA